MTGRLNIIKRRRHKQQVFRYIVDYKMRNDGVAPTAADICNGCGFKSRFIVYAILRELEEDGVITRFYYEQRYIMVRGGKWTYEPQPDFTYDQP